MTIDLPESKIRNEIVLQSSADKSRQSSSALPCVKLCNLLPVSGLSCLLPLKFILTTSYVQIVSIDNDKKYLMEYELMLTRHLLTNFK